MKLKDWIQLVTTNLVVIFTTYYIISSGDQIQQKGSNPEKKLIFIPPTSINPFKDLEGLSGVSKVSLKLGERAVSNLKIVKTSIKNVGISPILPSDFFENITVKAPEPWEIIAIPDSTLEKNGPTLIWQKINDKQYVAKPVLINPGDSISTTVYLTDPRVDRPQETKSDTDPKLNWTARITNLKEFPKYANLDDTVSRMTTLFNTHVYVILSDWNLVYTFIAGMFNAAILIALISKRKWLPKLNLKSTLVIVLVMALSVAVGETSKTYLFGDPLTNILGAVQSAVGDTKSGVNHWFNAPAIIIDAALIILLINLPFIRRNRDSRRRVAR